MSLDMERLRAAAAELGYWPATTDDEHLNKRGDCRTCLRTVTLAGQGMDASGRVAAPPAIWASISRSSQREQHRNTSVDSP